jgi:hypothetical protein
MRRPGVLSSLAAMTMMLILPAPAEAGIIGSLSVSPSLVQGGASAQGTVTLVPDGTSTTVVLFSSDPSVATVPASVVAPPGVSSVTFTIATNAAAPPTIVTITAAVQNVPRTANLSVNAATPPGPSLSSVSVNPSNLVGGSPATGTITFTGVTNGAVVQLSSNNPAVVQVPSEAVVNGGASSAAFPVSTSGVTATTTATINATWFAVTRTTTVTLSPGAPPPADRVAITKARWKAGLLTIEATSTNPSAILSVYTQSGGFMFTLTNQGGGRYFDQRGWVTNPQVITVRSNLGGSATATLTG